MKQHAITLVRLAKKHGWLRGAELGVRRAETTVALLANTPPEFFIYAVDSFAPIEGPTGARNTKSGFKTYDAAKVAKFEADSRKALAPYEGRFELMKMWTDEAAPFIKDESLDFVFIDASHETAHVFSDIQNWEPKVRTGGAVLGHDYSWPSVRAALKRARIVPEALGGDVWLHWK